MPRSPESLLMRLSPQEYIPEVLELQSSPLPHCWLVWSCSPELNEAGRTPRAPGPIDFSKGRAGKCFFQGGNGTQTGQHLKNPGGCSGTASHRFPWQNWEFGMTPSCTAAHTQLSFTGKNGMYLFLPSAVFNLCPKLQWDIKSDRICCYSLFLVFHQILLLNHSAVAMLRSYCRLVTGPEHSKRLANEE